LLTQGRVLISQGDVDGARLSYSRAQALAPALPVLASELGAVYLRQGLLTKAEEQYRQAVQQSPNFADAHAGLGIVLQEQGKEEEARLQLARALEIDPNNSVARATSLGLRIAQGELNQARTETPQKVEETPQNGLLLVHLSELSLLRQDVFAAQQYARRAVSLLPDSSIAHYQLGRVYLEQGRTAQAEQEFRQAVVLDPENASARFALGYTRELAETGRDNSRPAAALNPSQLGGALRALDLQNLQTAGAEDRIQAALQDPTVARTATRSIGDTQIDGVIGTNGQLDGDISYLNESDDRRSLLGLTLGHHEHDGPRDNSDIEINRFGLTYGKKAKDNSSGLFFLAQDEQSKQGLNTGTFSSFAADARGRTQRPLVLFGGNAYQGRNGRTRFLIQGSRPEVESTGFMQNSWNLTQAKTFSAEVRHDVRLNNRNLLSAGFNLGRRKRTTEFLYGGVSSTADEYFKLGANIRSYSAYVRNEAQINKKLSLSGELQVHRLQVDSSFELLSPAPGFSFSSELTNGSFVLPKVIVDYRLNDRTGIRLRARRLAGIVEDFGLLTPTDLFATPLSDLPKLGLGGKGTGIELEADHTFLNTSFIRINIFDHKLRNIQEPSADSSAGAVVPTARLRGVRAVYEGVLNHDTTFFVHLNLNDARDNRHDRQISFVPRLLSEAGLFYLRPDGWFLQPSYVYQSARYAPTNTGRDKLPGFGLFNLRIGKRSGLQSTFYVEVANAFNQEFDILGIDQPQRQLRFGMSKRF
jgi:Flp pilus assembly protein TadD